MDQGYPDGLTDWEVRPVFKYSSPPEGSPRVDISSAHDLSMSVTIHPEIAGSGKRLSECR